MYAYIYAVCDVFLCKHNFVVVVVFVQQSFFIFISISFLYMSNDQKSMPFRIFSRKIVVLGRVFVFHWNLCSVFPNTIHRLCECLFADYTMKVNACSIRSIKVFLLYLHIDASFKTCNRRISFDGKKQQLAKVDTLMTWSTTWRTYKFAKLLWTFKDCVHLVWELIVSLAWQLLIYRFAVYIFYIRHLTVIYIESAS